MIQKLKSKKSEEESVAEVDDCRDVGEFVSILLSPVQGGVYLNLISLRRRERYINLKIEIKLDIVLRFKANI